MLSRLFLISTLLLVGITTIAIGAPVAETIEVIKAIKIPQMISSNPTLNRRFINGLPGLPQCVDENYPLLGTSFCLTETSIRAICGSQDNPGNTIQSDTNCPLDYSCVDFETQEDDISFAICINNDFIKFVKNDKDRVICKNLKITNVYSDTVTFGISVFDAFKYPVIVSSFSISMGKQFGNAYNTNNYSHVFNYDHNKDKEIKMCMDTGTNNEIDALYTFLDGSYN